MLNIPPEILPTYDALLEQNAVTLGHRKYYKKWLRFYLDFCQKYGFNTKDKNSFPEFNQKLQSKNQSESLRKQAHHAVSLYFKLFSPTSQDIARPLANITNDGISDSPDSPAPPDRPAYKPRNKPRKKHSSPKTSPNESRAAGVDTPPQMEAVSESRKESYEPKLTGASWVGFYEKLNTAIKDNPPCLSHPD